MKKRTIRLVTVQGKTQLALQTKAAAACERCAAHGERVLVVYGSTAASIYSEAREDALPLMPSGPKEHRR